LLRDSMLYSAHFQAQRMDSRARSRADKVAITAVGASLALVCVPSTALQSTADNSAFAAAHGSRPFSHARHSTGLHGSVTFNDAQSWGSSQTSSTLATVAGIAIVGVAARLRRAHCKHPQWRQKGCAVACRAAETPVVAQLTVRQKNAERFDFEKLDSYPLGDLEELYIDSLWCYYRNNRSLLNDSVFDALKTILYQKNSSFPTLRKDEVAFVEASIAYYRGDPVVSNEDYDALKTAVIKSGKRKDVTAFLLYSRGERFLDPEQFAAMKYEYGKLGIIEVDIESCNLAQLEEMYVDALWSYYNEGVQLLSDEQYKKLRLELDVNASGFPSLSRNEIDFVKGSIAYWQGTPVFSDSEWKVIKDKVLAEPRRKDVTAFLLYSRGQQSLPPGVYNQMKEEMAKMGVTLQKAGTKALEQTLSVTSDKLQNNLGDVLFMVSALGALPTIICTGLVWAIGLFFDYEFVPSPEWGSILKAEFLPLFGIGLTLGLAATYQLLAFLDLQGPRILTGSCPSCEGEVKLFSGGKNPPIQVEYACKACGCKMVLNTKTSRIESAGMGAMIDQAPQGFDFKTAWGNLKNSVGLG